MARCCLQVPTVSEVVGPAIQQSVLVKNTSDGEGSGNRVWQFDDRRPRANRASRSRSPRSIDIEAPVGERRRHFFGMRRDRGHSWLARGLGTMQETGTSQSALVWGAASVESRKGGDDGLGIRGSKVKWAEAHEKMGGKGEAPGKEFRRHSFELSRPLHWASNIPR